MASARNQVLEIANKLMAVRLTYSELQRASVMRLDAAGLRLVWRTCGLRACRVLRNCGGGVRTHVGVSRIWWHGGVGGQIATRYIEPFVP
jgi:hypothetical protein